MDEDFRNSSQPLTGNTAMPDWMQKRRARQQSQSPQPETPSDTSTEVRGAGTAVINAAEPEYDPASAFASIEEPKPKPAPTPEVDLDIRPAPATKPAKRAKPKPAPALVDPNLPENKPPEFGSAEWFQAMREEWLSREALGSYAVSLTAHLLIALVLSLFVFHREVAHMGLNTFLLGGDGGTGGEGGEGLDDSNLLEIDPAAGQAQPAVDTVLSANAVTDALGPNAIAAPEGIGAVALSGDGPGSGNGKGDKDGDGTGDGFGVGGFSMPEGGKVVRKGSFTAWTVPQDPAPGEDYKIIIQVQYKDRKQKLSPRDITGTVAGTDLFRLVISKYTAEFIPEANQVVVNIPGAAARVHDTIKIYSTILKENQRLEIDF